MPQIQETFILDSNFRQVSIGRALASTSWTATIHTNLMELNLTASSNARIHQTHHRRAPAIQSPETIEYKHVETILFNSHKLYSKMQERTRVNQELN